MNLQQLKAKYANNTTTATKVATTTTTAASKAWNTTKDTAVKAGSYVKDIAPATNRRVNSIAAELNAKYNNHEVELTKQRILIEMAFEAQGLNLPNEDELTEYALKVIKEQEEANKPQQETQVDATNVAQQIVEMFTKAFSKAQSKPVFSEEAQEALKQLEEQAVEADKEEQQEVVEQPISKKEERRLAAEQKKKEEPIHQKEEETEWKQCLSCGKDLSIRYNSDKCRKCRKAEKEAVSEEVEEQPVTKSTRRRLVRSAPLAE